MHILHALFGAPGDVAAKHTLTLKVHQLMASWLRCAEAMMRRLLVIEAAAFAKPNTRPLLRAPRKRKRKLMRFFPDAPEQWRVSFRCFSSPVHGGSVSAQRAIRKGAQAQSLDDHAVAAPSVAYGDTSPARGGGRQKFRSAWPLAERYEALLRVFANPLAYARRLAARLHATPHRLREMLRAPPEAAERVDLFSEFTETAARSWNTS